MLATLAAVPGCASIDFDYPRTESMAIADTGDTYLGAQLATDVSSKPEGQAGFYPLSDGIDALAARLLLAQRAERTIDLQYYLIKNDKTGRALVYALLDAADRGVRVRLLLDDVFTGGYDAAMAGLDSHPNFEIRIFNPFYRGFAGRARSGITSFGRINRRMHNKSFTVDNQITIVGGRNIADEYFGAREDAKFSDLDVAGIGPVVDDVSAMFDTYWNHETAVPLPAFAEMPDDPPAELERVRQGKADWKEEIQNSPYVDAVRQTVLNFVEADDGVFHWAPYSLVYDSPDKGVRSRSEAAESIRTPLVDALQSAEHELIVASPYFVPRKSGVEGFSELLQRGVQVTIITNSLAANNQFSVHAGYAPSRKPLLQNGIRIYEVRPDAEVAGAELIAASGAKATLHTKAFVVDQKEVFIGSFNFDPRSAYINTESGVIIRSPEMANNFAATVQAALQRQTYEVFLNEQGKLRWRGFDDGEEVIYDKEPQTSWGQRFAAGFMRILPIRGQL
jgi:putative cardiolipin synthase